MIYPDGEKISYSYNTAGLLESMKGEKAYSYNYLNKLGYDKFEQRVYMKYCNGAETTYSYDDQRRRLSNLMVISGKTTRSQIMNNAYSYDKVDNVLAVANSAPLPTTATGMGGQISHSYKYDGLYRLVSAGGTYTGANGKSATYSLDMTYDNLHNITSKKQNVQQQGVQFDGILKAGYELSYNYGSNPFQVSNLKDDNYRTEGTAAKDKISEDHAYRYDANGNQIYVNTSRQKQDGSKADKSQERKLLWDEENRLLALDDNGFVSRYWYDAGGERVIKESGDGEGIYVNNLFSGGRTETGNFTAYINPYLVVSPGGSYTKHIYIGNQRIVSKLGDLDSYGADPRRIPYAGADVEGSSVDYKGKYTASIQNIKDAYKAFDVPYYGKDNDDYVNGQGFCCNNTKSALKAGAIGTGNDNPELYQYYYHSDHLGSSSLITNLDGETVQHIEYVPFGEVFIEERNNVWNTPYKFNAKELDEETGLYYYGARYYDPRISLWYGVDPLAEEYPNMSGYAYCANNPVKFIDPNGKWFWIPVLLGFIFESQPVSTPTRNSAYERKVMSEAWHDYNSGVLMDFIPVGGKAVAISTKVAVTQVGKSVAKKVEIKVEKEIANELEKELEKGAQKTKRGSQIWGKGAEHKNNIRPSSKNTHQRGRSRKLKDQGGEKGDKRRPYRNK